MKVNVPDCVDLGINYPGYSVTANDEGIVKIVCQNDKKSRDLLQHFVDHLTDMNRHLYLSGPFKDKVVNGKLETTVIFKERKASKK